MTYDFKKYHVRAINATDDAERARINQELKDVYAGLNETEKLDFNAQLQFFLMTQYKTIGSEYEALKAGGAFN